MGEPVLELGIIRSSAAVDMDFLVKAVRMVCVVPMQSILLDYFRTEF